MFSRVISVSADKSYFMLSSPFIYVSYIYLIFDYPVQ